MDCYVYILQSASSGRLYIGHTQDLDRRLAEHKAGRSAATRGRGPWDLLGAVRCASRAEAQQLEYRLKRWKNPDRVRAFLQRRSGAP